MDFIYKMILIKLLPNELNIVKINEIILDDSNISFMIATIITTPFIGTPLALVIWPASYVAPFLFLKILKYIIKKENKKYNCEIETIDLVFINKVLKEKSIRRL